MKKILSIVLSISLLITMVSTMAIVASADLTDYDFATVWTPEHYTDNTTWYTENAGINAPRTYGETLAIDESDSSLQATAIYSKDSIFLKLDPDVSLTNSVGLRVRLKRSAAKNFELAVSSNSNRGWNSTYGNDLSKLATDATAPAYQLNKSWYNGSAFTTSTEYDYYYITWNPNPTDTSIKSLNDNLKYRALCPGHSGNNYYSETYGMGGVSDGSLTTDFVETIESLYVLFSSGSKDEVTNIESVEAIYPSGQGPSATTKYTVTYAQDAGGYVTVPSSAKVEEGADYTVAAPTAVDNKYNFTGWTDGTNTYAAGDVISNVTGDITLTATVASKYSAGGNLWDIGYFDADDYAQNKASTDSTAKDVTWWAQSIAEDSTEEALKVTLASNYSKGSVVSVPLASNLANTEGIKITLKGDAVTNLGAAFGLSSKGNGDWDAAWNALGENDQAPLYIYNGNQVGQYDSAKLTTVEEDADGNCTFTIMWDEAKFWTGYFKPSGGFVGVGHTKAQKYLNSSYMIDETTSDEFLSNMNYLFIRIGCNDNYAGTTSYIKSVQAVTATQQETDYSAIAGKTSATAQLRIGDKNGIRFTTNVNADLIAQAKEEGYTVTMGTLIAPLSSGDLALDTDPVINLVSGGYFNNQEGVIAGSIVNIKDTNITKDFVARGYVTLTKDEVSTTYYATQPNEGRSLKTVAAACVDDGSFFGLLNDAQKAQVTTWATWAEA